MKGRRFKITALYCFKCKDLIYSRHRHDFKHCECGEHFIDGGRDYVRFGYKDPGDYELLSVLLPWASAKAGNSDAGRLSERKVRNPKRKSAAVE